MIDVNTGADEHTLVNPSIRADDYISFGAGLTAVEFSRKVEDDANREWRNAVGTMVSAGKEIHIVNDRTVVTDEDRATGTPGHNNLLRATAIAFNRL